MRKTNPFVGTETAREHARRRAKADPEFAVAFDAAFSRRQVARMIRAAREEKKLSQAELARRAGTKQPHIARLESGTETPGLEVLSRIATALGLKLRISLDPRPQHA